MRTKHRTDVLRAVAVMSAAIALSSPILRAEAVGTTAPAQLHVPMDYYKLPNGLKVVLSRDTTTPTTVVAVYYNIGFRNEPKDRTGFAHLFEHMMFQGSQNLGKMEFIRLVESNGGLLNGSTRFDFTNYYEVVPSHVLETILWAEARSHARPEHRRREPEEPAGSRQERGQGQRAEPALRRLPVDRPADGGEHRTGTTRTTSTATSAHLDAATLDDVRTFFKTFYAPNNAVLVITGDFEARARQRRGLRSTSRAFPSAKLPARADLQRAAAGEGTPRRAVPIRWPTGPALGIGYHMPERAHARVVRVRTARSGAGAGRRLAALRRARAQGGAHRQRRRRHQLGPRQHVRLQRADALDGAGLPRLDDVRPTSCWRHSTGHRARPSNSGLDQATLDRARERCARRSTPTSSSSPASAAPTCWRRSRSSTTTRRASISSKRNLPR